MNKVRHEMFLAFLLPQVWVGCDLGPSDEVSPPAPPPVGDATSPQLDVASSVDVLHLWRIDPTLDLVDRDVSGERPVETTKLDVSPHPSRPNTYVASSGLGWIPGQQFGAPAWLSVNANGEPLSYLRRRNGGSWKHTDDTFEIVWTKRGPLPTFTVTNTRASFENERLNVATAGLDEQAFVAYRHEHVGRSVDGLLLPTQSSASWDVDIPKDGLLVIQPALIEAMPDGATARVHVDLAVDGRTQTVATRNVTQKNTLARWKVPLDAWSGQSVRLTLRTSSAPETRGEPLFIGRPTLLSAAERGRQVVVIGIDTIRPDRLGFYGYDRDTSPELDRIASTSYVFEEARTPAPRTRPSFRSAMTGRTPLNAVGAATLGEVFDQQGFATAGIVANLHLAPRFQFDAGFHEWWFDGKSNAKSQVDRAIQFLSTHSGEDVFLFLHVMDPHIPYAAPPKFREKFTLEEDPDLPVRFFRDDVLKWMATDGVDARRKQHISDRYDGGIAYMSEQMGRLFDHLDAHEGASVTIVHSDHGEELWEHDGFEHNHTLYDEVVRGLLWVRPHGGLQQGVRLGAPTTLADIAPTLYDMLGVQDAPASDGRSLVPLMTEPDRASEWDARAIGIGHLRMDYQQWGVLYKRHKYILTTFSGEERLYNLDDDPGESTNVAGDHDLEPWRRALAEAHGATVGPGIRLTFSAANEGTPVTVAFDKPFVDASVFPPDATHPKPPNEAWGQPPRRTLQEIGHVEIAADRRSFQFTAGPKADKAHLYVLFEGEPDLAGLSVKGAGSEMPVNDAASQRAWRDKRQTLRAEPGTILVPPPSEASRMRALSGEDVGAAEDRTTELLCELGYMECD